MVGGFRCNRLRGAANGVRKKCLQKWRATLQRRRTVAAGSGRVKIAEPCLEEESALELAALESALGWPLGRHLGTAKQSVHPLDVFPGLALARWVLQ